MMRLIVVVLSLILVRNVVAAIEVEVEPRRVPIGETFRVVFTFEPQQGASEMPDLTPFQRDFTILGTERHMSYTVINGQAHSVAQWGVLLNAKKAGTLEIPSIQIGAEKSTISYVDILQQTESQSLPTAERGSNKPLFLSATTQLASPFVSQEVRYTVKLYNSVRLLDAAYQPPQVDDALVIPLGEGQHSEAFLNGRHYEVEEQDYAIFPQKSGSLTIRPPVFSALAYETVPQRVQVQAKPRSLIVKPIPPDYKGAHWLPATALTLSETYDADTSSLKKGSTLVRTIRLEVDGMPGQLLPELQFKNQEGYRLYVEKPLWRNKIRAQRLIGSATIHVTYVLNKTGTTVIPELSLVWFNTQTGKEEVASLPPRPLMVEGPAVTVAKSLKSPSAMPRSAVKKIKRFERVPVNKPWLWFAIGAFFVLLSIGLAILIRPWREKHCVWKGLRDACCNADPTKMREALLRWAQWQWPSRSIVNLGDILKQVNHPLLEGQIALLWQVLYGPGHVASWNGNTLWNVVRTYSVDSPAKKKSDLPPLNLL